MNILIRVIFGLCALALLAIFGYYGSRFIRLVVMDVQDKRHDRRTAKSMFGPRRLSLAAEGVPVNAFLTDEERRDLGSVHYECYDLWYDGDSPRKTCDCRARLDAWQESRRAAA